jgi:hypothetical protein
METNFRYLDDCKDLNLRLMDLCDEVYVLLIDGWEQSSNLDAEVTHAVSLNKPITFIDEYGIKQPMPTKEVHVPYDITLVNVLDTVVGNDYRIVVCPDCAGRGIPKIDPMRIAQKAMCGRCQGWGKMAKLVACRQFEEIKEEVMVCQ